MPGHLATSWLIRFWTILFCMYATPATISSGEDRVQTEQAKASVEKSADTDFVVQELSYHAPGAAEVYLIWGINGLQPVHEAIRPPGTYLDENKVMRTHLVRAGETFTTTLRVPRGSHLEYTFMIATRKDAGGTDVWQNESDSGRPFSKNVKNNGRIVIQSTIQLSPAEDNLLTKELRFIAPKAREVYLVWGINGRQPLPEPIRPSGTYLDDQKIMRTQMARAGDAFNVTLRIPRGSKLEFTFVLAIKQDGGAPDIWKSEMDSEYVPFSFYITYGGRIEIRSGEARSNPVVVTDEQRNAWLAGEETNIPLVTQEILYHAPLAGEVWLVWGLNGWRVIPAASRPVSTLVNHEGFMQTRMVKKSGDIFAAHIKVPTGMRLNHRFLITKTVAETPVHFTDEASGRLRFTIHTDSVINIEPTSTPVAKERFNAWLAGKPLEIPLVPQELSFTDNLMRPSNLRILWGIDGWQTIPESARPPRTVLDHGVMHSTMAQKGNTFTAKLLVPPRTSIDYHYLIDNPDTSGALDNGNDGILLGLLDGRLEVESGATKVVLEQRKTWPSGRLADLSLVAQEIRYRIAGAAEVWLVWGINGWQSIPEEARPKGTVIKDKVMYSPMKKSGEIFATTVPVPAGTMLDYKFLIAKTSRGLPASIWQESAGQAFWKLVRNNGSSDHEATVTVVTDEQRKAWLANQAVDLPLVTWEIRYHAPEAAEVWFGWGLDGWQPIPEAHRPPDTALADNKVMQTRMVQKGDKFVATVRVPPGAELDFGFFIAKTREGKLVNVWHDRGKEGEAFTRVANFDGSIEVVSTAWLSARASESLSLVTQQFRYRIAGAQEVWLVWGINGWQAVPEEARPNGTVLNGTVMQTPMVGNGEIFAATVRVPPKTTVDYKFLITKTNRGAPVSIWQDSGGQAFQLTVRASGSREEQATVTVVTAEQRKAWLVGQMNDLPLVRQGIRYRNSQATEASLVWGLEGWQLSPETMRPPGTILKDKVMRSRMVRDGNAFVATIQLPPGTELNFWFLVGKSVDGKFVEFRQTDNEEGRTLSRVVLFDSVIDVRPRQ
jgi:hypothetical protein